MSGSRCEETLEQDGLPWAPDDERLKKEGESNESLRVVLAFIAVVAVVVILADEGWFSLFLREEACCWSEEAFFGVNGNEMRG